MEKSEPSKSTKKANIQNNKILKESNIEIIKSPKGVEVVRRNINNEEKYFVMNHTDKTQQLGDKTIKPYEAFIADHI